MFTDQDPAAKPQLEIIDKLKNGNDELRKLRSTVLSWYVDEYNQLHLRKMAETMKMAFDGLGTEITYHMDMIKANNKGTPVFNIRVMMFERSRVRDSSTKGEVGSEEEETDFARGGPAPRAPQPPSADREPPPRTPPRRPNPFSPQPAQRHYTDPSPYAFRQYANYPHGMPDHTYQPSPMPGQWTGPSGYYPPGPGYPHGGPAGYR